MSFISKISSRLFKAKQLPKENSKKIDHLEKLPLEELMTVIQNAKDDNLRNSAVQKINQLSNLLMLADIHSGKASVNNLQKSAKKRIAQLLDSNEISGTDFCKSVEDPIQRFAILGLMSNQSLADAELAAIQDEALLTRIVMEATSSRIRQAAAERVIDAEHLFHLLKECKNADKSVYKIIKEKCDLIKATEKQQEELIAHQMQLITSLEQHAHRFYDAYYAAKFDYLQQQWAALINAKDALIAEDIQTRAQAAMQVCSEKIAVHKAEEHAQEKLQNALAAADQQFTDLADGLDQLLTSLVNGSAADDEIRQQLAAWQYEWNLLSELKQPTKPFRENITRQRQALEAEMKIRSEFGTLKEHSFRLELHINNQSPEAETFYRELCARIKYLKPFTALIADLIQSADQACEKFVAKQKGAAEESQLKLRQFGGLVRKAKEALDQGELKKASSLRHTIEEKLPHIKGLPTHIAHQIEQLDEAIEKLQDWKAYAVAPKKLELIAQMEALVSSALHPEVRAEKIKRLQDEWKQLSKGISDQEQWETFHQLAQQAYAPCQIYFAEQAALRAANLEQCKKLAQQLSDYLQLHNWEAFDWRAAEQVMRVARQEWRNYSPTERAATQPVLNQFENSLEQIYQKILQEQTRISGQKQNLIERVTQLAQIEDMRKAIDSVKSLQVEWQSLGVCGHKQEQQLWQSFRQACDQVFAKRQQQSAEFKAELDANHESAKQSLQQLATILKLSGKALLEARSQVDEVRKSFSGLGQLPKAVVNEIRAQFQSEFQAFDEKVIAERAKEKQQIWINLFEAADKICQFELSLVESSKLSRQEITPEQKEELQTYLQQLTPLPTGGLKALQQKFERVSADTDPEENLERLRHLCVSAELLMQIVSPEADLKLRQSIQVEQLQQNFGKKILNSRAEMESLVFEWLKVGAVAQPMYQELFKRFNQCLLNAMKNTEAKTK